MRAVDKYRVEVERLRAELRHRPRQLPLREQLRRQAVIDAQTLYQWELAGLVVSRRDAPDWGMSERRWRRARPLLKRLKKWGRI